LKPASTPSSPNAKSSRCPTCPASRRCRGRLLRRALLASSCAATAFATCAIPQQPAGKVAASRANELTLAGLRPGRDTIAKAKRLHRSFSEPSKEQGEAIWEEACRKSSLIISYDSTQKIETIRVRTMQGPIDADCFVKSETEPWRTGRGLAIKDPAAKIIQLYGQPDSKSPSTRDGQPLELWYYAFDWAGPDVPQVMEILCTREKEGQPGRVVEITLAAPSL
jgi:hypothetical protein